MVPRLARGAVRADQEHHRRRHLHCRRPLLPGEAIPEIIPRLKRDLIPTIKSGLIYWPLCDFYHFQVYPHSFTAAGEQFLLVSLDHLHNIHGQLKEGICGGGHELVVIALDDFHATELSASYFCMAVFKEMNYDVTINSI